MDDNKKKWIKRVILIAVDLALAAVLSYVRYRSLSAEIAEMSIFHALSDGFFVIGFFNLGFGALVKISSTGFFDIFGFAFKSFLNFFIPRSVLDENKGGYYEYKVKKAEKRKETMFFRDMLIAGVCLMVLGIVCNLLVYR